MNLHVNSVSRRPGAPRKPRGSRGAGLRKHRFMSIIALPRLRLGRRKVAGVSARHNTASGAAAVWLPAGQRALRALRSARLVSLLILAGCLAAFAFLLNDPQFYVTRPEVVGRKTIPVKDIYAMTGAPGLHLFWVNPAEMEAALEASPSIERAHVSVGWPDRVRIEIVERAPVAVWQQAGAVQWVAGDGRLMPARGDLPGLLRIVVTSGRPLPEDARSVDASVVRSALALQAVRPNITALNYYDRGGLEYDDGRGWQVYFGTGDDMAQKVAVYETLVDYLLGEKGLQPQQIAYIAVTDVRHPFYRLRGEE